MAFVQSLASYLSKRPLIKVAAFAIMFYINIISEKLVAKLADSTKGMVIATYIKGGFPITDLF